MITVLVLAIVVALEAGFVILFLGKTGIREQVQVHAPKLLSEMFSCDFCLSWWVCLAITVAAAAMAGEWDLILAAVLAAPITRHLIS